jgi:isopentenyl diphosphate isomerase/L-lactate dehydrogenase-like FMN-dependent dehydrogenase
MALAGCKNIEEVRQAKVIPSFSLENYS